MLKVKIGDGRIGFRNERGEVGGSEVGGSEGGSDLKVVASALQSSDYS